MRSHFFFRRSLVPAVCAAALVGSFSGCQSSSSKIDAGSSGDARRGSFDGSANDSADSASYVPGAQNVRREPLSGTVFTLDGSKATAQTLILSGDSRRPIFADNQLLTFAKRRVGSDRWQVFETDLKRQYERRISFDAGDSEPIVSVGGRLVVATSSQLVKSSDRVLDKYRSRFATPEPNREPRSENPTEEVGIGHRSSLHHLLIEAPASARRRAEWLPMSKEPSEDWALSFDRELKNGIAVMKNGNPSSGRGLQTYRITQRTTRIQTESRVWEPLRVQTPAEWVSVTPRDGRVFPDGRRVLWSNGTFLWTTTIAGQDPQKFGDTTFSEIESLSIDPSGEWIVVSAPVSGEGLNLTALHASGKCRRSITEMSGDETDPTFSPDGQTLAFTFRSKDQSSRIALISLERKENGAPACTER